MNKVLVRIPVSHDHGAITPATHNAVIKLALSGFPMVEGYVALAGSVFVLREQMAGELLNREDVTHLLMIDSDIAFEPRQAIALLRYRKQIIAGVYRRRASGEFVAGTFDSEGVAVPVNGSGLQVRDWCGMGFILIDRTVFAKLHQPWFATVDEDLGFCRALKAAGIPLWVDYDCVVGHVVQGII